MRLIGIGLDGTPLNSDQNISQKNAKTMQHLPGDRFPFICSGGEVEGINNTLKKSGLMALAVGLNGSVGFDGEEKIFESFLDKKDVKKTDSVISKFPTKTHMNLGSYESQNYKNEMRKIFHEVGSEFSVKGSNYELRYEKSICSIPYNNVEEIIEKDDISIYKSFILIPNRQLKVNIFNRLKKMLNVIVTESAPVSTEIVSQNVSKGTVFDYLGSIYNLEKPLRIAVGDSLNDLSMFENINISFVMGNSHREIMRKADCITVSNDKGGVSQAFERILTIQTNLGNIEYKYSGL